MRSFKVVKIPLVANVGVFRVVIRNIHVVFGSGVVNMDPRENPFLVVVRKVRAEGRALPNSRVEVLLPAAEVAVLTTDATVEDPETPTRTEVAILRRILCQKNLETEY